MTNLGYIPEEPICAIATALNPGAIGIVRASGKERLRAIPWFMAGFRKLVKKTK